MAFRGGDYYLEFVYVDRFAGYSCGYGGEPERTAFGFVPQVLAGSLDGGGQAYGHLSYEKWTRNVRDVSDGVVSACEPQPRSIGVDIESR